MQKKIKSNQKISKTIWNIVQFPFIATKHKKQSHEINYEKEKKQIFANAVKKSQSIKKLDKVTHTKPNILSFYCEKNYAGYMCGLYLIMIIFLNSEMQPPKKPTLH